MEVGTPHEDGCDVARCLWTGGQRLQCELGLIAACVRTLRFHDHDELAQELADSHELDDADHHCGRDVWTGEWPGTTECREYGLWVRWGPPWIKCAADYPGATEDLNTLVSEYKWDRQLAKRVPR